ncbi:MAG: DMT family transporter [Acidimicrobiales bacterium]
MAYVLALGAALANAVTTILQRIGVETAPKEASMHLSLITHAIHRRVWLVGMGLMVASFGLQATALAKGRLSLVQPVLTSELPILVIILVVWFGQRIGWHEVVGSTAAAGGLAAFLLAANPQGGDNVPSVRTWGLASIAGIGAISISVALARRGSPAWRAAWFGTSAAISYAFTAAFAKQVTEQIGVRWYSPFQNWQIWGMAVAGLCGVFLTQNAFHAGPVTASQSTLVIVDPICSLLLGIGLFGDNLQTSGARGPLESLALIVLFGGVYFLARSPLVATVRSEEEENGEHIYGSDRKHRHHSPAGLLGAPDAAQLAYEHDLHPPEEVGNPGGQLGIPGGQLGNPGCQVGAGGSEGAGRADGAGAPSGMPSPVDTASPGGTPSPGDTTNQPSTFAGRPNPAGPASIGDLSPGGGHHGIGQNPSCCGGTKT